MAVTLDQLQELIKTMYGDKDSSRGIDGTFMWFMEEVGELASGLRSGNVQETSLEFADVLAWLATLANCAGVNLTDAIQRKYGLGCPGCQQNPCDCARNYKP